MAVTRKQEQLISALLTSPTIAEAARVADVAERTVYRWLAEDEDFQQKYRQARREAVSQAVARLQQASTEAVETLRTVMTDSQATSSSRVSAAKAVLEIAFKAVELEDLEAQLRQLEELVEKKVV